MSSYQETGDIKSGMIMEKLLAVFKYLTEKNFQKARHEFECESGLFFDIKYFEELVVNGDWDEADRYLSCFTKWDDNRHSMKMFFEIKKQKYFEALDKCNFHEAADILMNELKVFSESDQELTKEMTDLLKNKREHRQLTGHANTEIQRKNLMGMLFNKLLINHPIISEKLQFPTLADSMLKHQFPKGSPNYSDASLASQSTHLVPVGQIEVGQVEPLQTIARPVPDPLSLPQNNLPTINQQGGAPLASINNFCDISNTLLSGISNTRILPAPGEYGSSRRLFDANAGITNSVGTINQDTPTLSRIRPETVTKDMRNNVNPRLDEVPPNKRMRLNVLSRPNQIRSLIVSEPPETDKITRLIYTNSGMALLALSSNGIQMFRKLPKSDTNPDSKAKTVHPLPSLWKPRAGKQMGNDFSSIDCFALSNDENFLMLASGGSLALFDTTGCETKGFSCPATATCLLFHPEDNNVIIVGMDDSTIQIFNVHLSKVKFKFAGHCRRITDLAFSTKLNVLVSSAADAEIIVWEYRDCKFKEMKKHSFLWFQDESILRSILWDTQVQFHQDQKHFLVVTELKFAIYTTELECKNQVSSFKGHQRCLPLDLSKMIVHATFSCDSQLVYIAIKNGTVAMFSFSNLQLLCEILRDAYLPSNISSHAYPIVIAAHPQKRNQIALGFSDGRVIVIELPESTAQQHVAPSPVESESTRSKTHTAQQMTMLPAPGEAGSSRPSFDANVEITSGGLALQSSHLVPAGCQIEPQQTIARPVPDPLSLQQRNLPTINQKGGSPFMRINKRGRFEVLRRPNQVRSLTVSEPLKTNTIMRLIYTNSGMGLLALDSKHTNLLWKWRKDEIDIKATTMYPPQLWEPEARKKMKNDLPDIEPKDPINCFALSNNDNFLMSATGGAVTLFNTKDSKKLADFMRPPPAATCLLFHPVDNNVIIAGMEDATIQIYNIRLDEVKFKIVGHSRRITGLAFSTKLNVLVSSAADAEIIVWKYIDDEKWIQKKKINVLQFERGGRGAPKSRLLDTRVQFHQDQNHFLAVNERRVAIFNTTEPESKKQNCQQLQEFFSNINHATFSCDGQLVYIALEDGTVIVLSASNLERLCLISRYAYLPSNVSSDKCPLAIAAHPQERSQFALGYTDGSVIVIEIPESIAQQKIVLPPVENESTRSKTPTAQQIVGSGSDKRPSA